MKRSNSEIEQMLKNAYTNITPSADCAAMSSSRPANNNVIQMSSARTRRQGWQYRVASLAAAFVLVFIGAFGYVSYNEHNVVDSIVDIDVNPSVELKLSKRDKVLEVNAVNNDAEEILSNLELKQKSLDEAVDMIISAMVEQGYISDDANAVLISVGNGNAQRSEELRSMLSTEVEEVLRQRSIDPAIFSQTVRGGEARFLAERYGISLGKATLIKGIVSSDTSLNPGELSQLPVNDIMLIAGSKAQNVVTTVSGSASDKAYIGEGAAQAIAANHAGVSQQSMQNLAIGMSVENGVMIYEVGFTAAGMPFAYEIDAKTGAILGFVGKPIVSQGNQPSAEEEEEEEKPEENPEDVPQEPVYAVTSEQAQAIVFESLGIGADQAENVKVKLEKKEDRALYKITFTVGSRDYTYLVDADTAQIAMRGWQSNGNVPALPPVDEPLPEGQQPADPENGEEEAPETEPELPTEPETDEVA